MVELAMKQPATTRPMRPSCSTFSRDALRYKLKKFGWGRRTIRSLSRRKRKWDRCKFQGFRVSSFRVSRVQGQIGILENRFDTLKLETLKLVLPLV